MNTHQVNDQEPARNDPHGDQFGVLLSDEIEYYARNHKLISPFRDCDLRPAGYSLHVGDEFIIKGQRHHFEDQQLMEVTIDPYEVAIIKIEEHVCLPRFLIGRWDIKVSLAYRGLMWVGGAQVDPGFKGHLFCPIYNLSNRTVRLRKGEAVAVIDFVKTTPFNNRSIEFETEKNANRDFHDYKADELESALVKQEADIRNVTTKAEMVEIKLTTFTTIVVSLLGLFGLSRFIDEETIPQLDWTFAFALVLILVVIALALPILQSARTVRVMQATARLLGGGPEVLYRMFRRLDGKSKDLDTGFRRWKVLWRNSEKTRKGPRSWIVSVVFSCSEFPNYEPCCNLDDRRGP